MKKRNPSPCALTIDDAPVLDPARLGAGARQPMDAVREQLQRRGVERCVAFVIGRNVHGHEGALERWLAAGYELGNHTHEHPWASRLDADAFIESIARCDELLTRLGAFDAGRARYFRHPFGDRGQPHARDAIARALRERGYVLADVSINLHDYAYEGSLHDALARNDPTRALHVDARYLQTVRAAIARARGMRVEPGFVHVACCHFGLVTVRNLDRVLDELLRAGPLRGLEAATSSPTYARIAADPRHNGTAEAALLATRERRAVSKLARLSRKLGLLQQRSLGPRWPHLG